MDEVIIFRPSIQHFLSQRKWIQDVVQVYSKNAKQGQLSPTNAIMK